MCKRYEVHLKDDVMFVGDHISPMIPKDAPWDNEWCILWNGPEDVEEAVSQRGCITSIRVCMIAYIVDNGAPDAEPEP